MDICPRQCEHVQCEAKCGLKCTVPPCNEPCPKQIKCGHPCVGFCGDECPPLCRICDKEELQTMFLGFEDEEDARYVLLIECNHVIESQGMDIWLSQKKEEGEFLKFLFFVFLFIMVCAGFQSIYFFLNSTEKKNRSFNIHLNNISMLHFR